MSLLNLMPDHLVNTNTPGCNQPVCGIPTIQVVLGRQPVIGIHYVAFLRIGYSETVLTLNNTNPIMLCRSAVFNIPTDLLLLVGYGVGTNCLEANMVILSHVTQVN